MLKTERLTIKPFAPEDQADAIELLTNAEIGKTYMLPEFREKEEAIPLFQRLCELSRSEEHYQRGIYLEGKLIGFLNDVEISAETIEMGYMLHPDYWGRGYATEAFSAVIRELFRRGFSQVTAGAFAENAASRRVMEKCGMHRLEKEEDLEYRGKTFHCVYYGIQKE